MALLTLSLMIDQLSATSSGVTSAEPQDPTSAFAGGMYFWNARRVDLLWYKKVGRGVILSGDLLYPVTVSLSFVFLAVVCLVNCSIAMVGSKKPINVFRLGKTGEPSEIFNWRLWFAVLAFGLLGGARGVDEGLISGAFNSEDFQNFINLNSYSEIEQANIKGNVSAMVQIGSVGGALLAFLVCDRIGRLWATRQLCLLWILGIAIFMGNNGNLGAVYAGRFVAGLGVGQSVVVGPVYLAEIAPASVRGLCTCSFTGFVYVAIVLAYFANYGAELHMPGTHNRWLVPTSLHIIFAGLIFVLSIFQYESPRYLVKKGKNERALHSLSQLRQLPPDHEYVSREFTMIQSSHQIEMAATMEVGWLGVVKEIFLVPNNFYRAYLVFTAQILSQWSGAGSITLYAPDFFRILGIDGDNTSLLVTAIFGIVKLVASVICALFLVDVIGRKRSLLLGITLQSISMVYVAGFLSAFPKMGIHHSFELPGYALGASRGAIAMIYISGFGWALGWNSMQYLLTAELFPLRIRAVSASIAMVLHFVNQYGNSRAVPNMLLSTEDGGITPAGTFWCFAAITIIGGLWVFITVPETSGRTLESMDRLFELPWYRIGLYGNKDADERDMAVAEKEDHTTDNERRASEGDEVVQV